MAQTIREYGHFINGAEVGSNGSAKIEVTNPATGDVVAVVPDGAPEDVNAAVVAAKRGFETWGFTSARERSGVLRRMAELIRERATELLAIEVSEVGRPISEMQAVDIPETADCFDYYSSAARLIRGSTISLMEPYHDFTLMEPVGVVGQIIPWNFPFNLAAWKVAPALAAGNCIVLKPSDFTPSTAVEMARIAKVAGLPDGVLNVVTGRGGTGAHIVEHPMVDMIAFTGGQQTGYKIAEVAGRLGKRVSLELGGKSAQLIFEDCDIDAALAGAMEGAFFAQGENCCAGSRILVSAAIREQFVTKLADTAAKLVVGMPESAATQVGCLISMDHCRRVTAMINEARGQGATVFGGEQIPRELVGKPFVAPTIVIDPPSESRIVQEEVFGPVVVVNTFENDEDAIRVANSTKYDLAAAIWTNDVSRAHAVARRLRAGTVWVNTFNRVFNDAPFGGHRGSGFGRDLGLEAMQQYVNIKNVCICTKPGSDKWFTVT